MNEELRCANAELTSANGQLQTKVEELCRRTAELDYLLGSSDVATLFLDAERRIRFYTPGLSALVGVTEADIGRSIEDFAIRLSDGALLERIGKVQASALPDECEVRSEDGRWLLQRIRPYRLDGTGGDGVVVTFIDITERHAAERWMAEAREFSEAIVETVPVPLLVLTDGLRVVSANRAFHGTFGGDCRAIEGMNLNELDDARWDSVELREALADLVHGKRILNGFEVRQDGPDGVLNLLVNARRLEGMRLILLAIEDVSRRRKAEAHQRMLMAELNHRVKNTLAVVNAIAFQTLRRSVSMEGFVEAFEGRMQSLARTHSALAEAGWEPADLGALVAAWLEPHGATAQEGFAAAADGGPPPAIDARGAAVTATPQQSVALGMALHELATNAARYGALSAPGGRLAVRWEVEPRTGNGSDGTRQVRLTWVESGGPRVAEPVMKGFGTRFVQQICAYDLGGEARLDFAPEGLRFELVFPVA